MTKSIAASPPFRSIPTTGLLFVGDFSGFIHCLDAETGKLYWIYDMKAHMWGSTMVADGKVYAGDEDGDFTVLAATKGKKLPADKVKPGGPENEAEFISETNLGSAVYGTPIVANGVDLCPIEHPPVRLLGRTRRAPRSTQAAGYSIARERPKHEGKLQTPTSKLHRNSKLRLQSRTHGHLANRSRRREEADCLHSDQTSASSRRWLPSIRILSELAVAEIQQISIEAWSSERLWSLDVGVWSLEQMASSPPGSPKLTLVQWLVCAIAAIGFLFDTYELLMTPLVGVPAIAELLQLPPNNPAVTQWTGRLLWLSALSGGVFGLLGGWLIDRFGRKSMMAASIFVYSLSPVAAAMSTSLGAFLFFRCATFIGVCVEFVAAITWLAELFPEPKRKKIVLGSTQAFASVGGLLVTGVNAWVCRERTRCPRCRCRKSSTHTPRGAMRSSRALFRPC